MRPQVADNTLIFGNKYGRVVVMPERDLAQWAELQAEADYEADAPYRALTGIKFAILFSLPFWMLGIYLYLRFR